MYTALGAAELKQATRSTQRVSNFLGSCWGAFQEWRKRERLRAELYGLKIERRSTDNPKEFAGSGLLLPRFGQFARKPRIDFFYIDFRRRSFAHSRSLKSLDRPARRFSALHLKHCHGALKLLH